MVHILAFDFGAPFEDSLCSHLRFLLRKAVTTFIKGTGRFDVRKNGD